MNTKMSRTSGVRIAATLIGCICAGIVGAQQPQQQQLDTRSLPASRVQAASCAEVDWASELLAEYPRIAEGCQEVVIAEGNRWARFEADLVRNNRDGSVTLDFKNRDGGSIEQLTLMPASEQRVLIDGRRYRFSELIRGQELNIYVPEGMFAAAVEPGSPPEQLAQIVREPIEVAQAEPAPVAQAEPRLPSTAGPLPLFLVAGLASLLAGLGLTLRRRHAAKRAVLRAGS